MSTISLPTSCLLDKNVVREALRGLVRATLGMPLPPRQGTSLGVVHALIAHCQPLPVVSSRTASGTVPETVGAPLDRGRLFS